MPFWDRKRGLLVGVPTLFSGGVAAVNGALTIPALAGVNNFTAFAAFFGLESTGAVVGANLALYLGPPGLALAAAAIWWRCDGRRAGDDVLPLHPQEDPQFILMDGEELSKVESDKGSLLSYLRSAFEYIFSLRNGDYAFASFDALRDANGFEPSPADVLASISCVFGVLASGHFSKWNSSARVSNADSFLDWKEENFYDIFLYLGEDLGAYDKDVSQELKAFQDLEALATNTRALFNMYTKIWDVKPPDLPSTHKAFFCCC